MSKEKGIEMRLSKKGWNNVIIFGILLIIFIFNFSKQLRLSSDIPLHTAISPELTILEIETPDYIISRVGRNWKSEPNIGISSIHLEQIVNNWQTTPLESTSIQDISPSEFIIKFFVAEQQQPIIIQLHQQDNDRFILQVDEKLFLSLPSDKLVLFLGR